MARLTTYQRRFSADTPVCGATWTASSSCSEHKISVQHSEYVAVSFCRMLRAAHAPPLHKITKAEAAEIESLAAKHHSGTVEKGSFAAVAQSAADINERRATQQALEHSFPDTFGALAASAVPAHVEQATAMGPPLRSITLAQAAAVTREAVKAARRVEHGSFASLCQSAAERLARARRDVAAAATTATEGAEESTWRSSVVVPLSAGGDAAAARTLDFDKVCSALRGTPFDLETIDMEHLRLLESAAARDHGGIIEHNSYAARAQAEVNKREPWRTVPHSTVVPAAAGGDAALAHANSFPVVAPYVPPLSSITADAAQRIYAAAKAAAGTVQEGSYAQRAIVAAAPRQEPTAQGTQPLQQQLEQQQHGGAEDFGIIPKSVGGPAAAARRDALHAVVQVAPPLSTMTKKLARQIESEAMRAAGTIESGSYAALAQSAAAHNAAVWAAEHTATVAAEPAPASTVGGATSATTAADTAAASEGTASAATASTAGAGASVTETSAAVGSSGSEQQQKQPTEPGIAIISDEDTTIVKHEGGDPLEVLSQAPAYTV
eukprot:5704-Heterococcus_DN1.PRE.3